MKGSLVGVALIESETSVLCYPLYLEGVLERKKEEKKIFSFVEKHFEAYMYLK